MRRLAPATIAALRQVPNAPGLTFKVYLRQKGWTPGAPDIVTNFSEFVVQDSLGSIDWMLERDYAQLSPGDVQFKVRDTLDQFETVVVRAPSPCEVQIWSAPAWGGMPGDWALLFHGYIEPSGITRGEAELGSGGEPTVPLKDVYAKSYLSARLDALRAKPIIGAFSGPQRLTDIVERIGSGAITAGHEPIDYDIIEQMIPTKDGRLVRSSWLETSVWGGPLWLYKETPEWWYFYQFALGSVRALKVDRASLRIVQQDSLAWVQGSRGRFHYWGDNYVLLTVSRDDIDWTSALPPHDLRMEQLVEVVLLRRSSAGVVVRWLADSHRITNGGFKFKATGYCCVSSSAPYLYSLALFYAPFADVGDAPAWEESHVAALLSEAELLAGSGPGWNSGRQTTGYVAGGAGAVRIAPSGSWVAATLLYTSSGNRYAALNRWYHAAGVLTDNGYSIALRTLGVLRLDDQHEICAMAGRHILYESDTNNQSYDIYSNLPHVLANPRPIYLNESRMDEASYISAVGLVDSGGHYNIVHYIGHLGGAVVCDFYRASDNLLDIPAGREGYFVKLNHVPIPPAYPPGTTGHFYALIAAGGTPAEYIDARFFPVFDLTAGAPSDGEMLRAFIGRLCEATGHMILFPGRATPGGNIIWRVRPRHTQPPDYTIAARDILADGIEVAGPRKLRLIVTTQGSTYAYPDTETLALARMSELTINNDGIPPSVADDFAYWLWLLFEMQNRIVKCETDAAIWVEVGDSVDLPLGLVDYFQGVVTRQSLDSVTGRGRCELLCAVAAPGTRVTPVTGEAD